MMKNKKAQWMKIATIALAMIFLVISLYIIGPRLSEANENIGKLDSCKMKKGICKEKCGNDESEYENAFGCGSGKEEKNKFCCVPQNI